MSLRLTLILACLMLVCLSRIQAQEKQTPSQRAAELILVQGAPGEPEYEEKFGEEARFWREACAQAGIHVTEIGQDERAAEALAAALKQTAQRKEGQLWLVLIGHGTYDGREAKFNLRGPDITPRQLAEWCLPIQRELVLIHGGSASAAFLPAMAGKGRVIVTGTKSADEIYYARFGGYFAKAIAGDLAADLDQDRQVTVLEAFRQASRLAADFYEKEERIATEHALIEDNGDGTGTRAETFTTSPEEAKDGARARQIALILSEDEQRLTDAQRARRDELERQLETLKARRPQMPEAAYYQELEKLLRELAAIYSGS
jgi:hypothetical protein